MKTPVGYAFVVAALTTLAVAGATIGSAPGLPEQRMEVTVEEGEHRVVRLAFRHTGPSKADTEPNHTLAYVLGGVAAAGVRRAW